jgi:hypothetical protein
MKVPGLRCVRFGKSHQVRKTASGRFFFFNGTSCLVGAQVQTNHPLANKESFAIPFLNARISDDPLWDKGNHENFKAKNFQEIVQSCFSPFS